MWKIGIVIFRNIAITTSRLASDTCSKHWWPILLTQFVVEGLRTASETDVDINGRKDPRYKYSVSSGEASTAYDADTTKSRKVRCASVCEVNTSRGKTSI